MKLFKYLTSNEGMNLIMCIVAMFAMVYIFTKPQPNVVNNKTEYNKGYDAGYDTGALCGSKLGYDSCVELLERVDDL